MEMREDIESVLRQLLRDYPDSGVDIILGVKYNGPDGQSGYVIRHTGDKVTCRRLGRMLWQSLTEERQVAAPKEVTEDDDS